MKHQICERSSRKMKMSCCTSICMQKYDFDVLNEMKLNACSQSNVVPENEFVEEFRRKWLNECDQSNFVLQWILQRIRRKLLLEFFSNFIFFTISFILIVFNFEQFLTTCFISLQLKQRFSIIVFFLIKSEFGVRVTQNTNKVNDRLNEFDCKIIFEIAIVFILIWTSIFFVMLTFTATRYFCVLILIFLIVRYFSIVFFINVVRSYKFVILSHFIDKCFW